MPIDGGFYYSGFDEFGERLLGFGAQQSAQAHQVGEKNRAVAAQRITRPPRA